MQKIGVLSTLQTNAATEAHSQKELLKSFSEYSLKGKEMNNLF
jgi:hypothetical protein